jgi:hypothetical protein
MDNLAYERLLTVGIYCLIILLSIIIFTIILQCLFIYTFYAGIYCKNTQNYAIIFYVDIPLSISYFIISLFYAEAYHQLTQIQLKSYMISTVLILLGTILAPFALAELVIYYSFIMNLCDNFIHPFIYLLVFGLLVKMILLLFINFHFVIYRTKYYLPGG